MLQSDVITTGLAMAHRAAEVCLGSSGKSDWNGTFIMGELLLQFLKLVSSPPSPHALPTETRAKASFTVSLFECLFTPSFPEQLTWLYIYSPFTRTVYTVAIQASYIIIII